MDQTLEGTGPELLVCGYGHWLVVVGYGYWLVVSEEWLLVIGCGYLRMNWSCMSPPHPTQVLHQSPRQKIHHDHDHDDHLAPVT